MGRIFSTQGRIGRLEYFLISMALYGMYAFIASSTLIILLLTGYLKNKTHIEQEEIILYLLIILVIPLYILLGIQIVKRFHDLNRPGSHVWYVFLVPFYNIYLLFLLLFKRGTQGRNEYGNDPLETKF